MDNVTITKSMQLIAYTISHGAMPINPELQLTPDGKLIVQSGIYPINDNRLIATGAEIDETLENLGMDFFEDGDMAQYLSDGVETIYTLEQWLAR